MKRALSLLSVVVLFVLASCSAESVEPLLEQVSSETAFSSATSGTVLRYQGKEPLIIVYQGDKEVFTPLGKIPPENITSIKVLKGNSAISAYGKKAKDGVVIIELKE
jgi:ABC-type tungstate transport system permease subunit